MRILHLTATYPPSVNGVAHYVKLLSDHQRSLGHQVMVFAPHHTHAPKKTPHVIRYPALPSPASANYPVGSPLYTPPALKKFQPQIVHAHHPLHFGYFALHLARLFQARIFLTHHTQYQIYIKTYFKQAAPPVNWLLNQHLLHLYRSLDGIICPTSALANLLRQQGVQNAVFIPNGIDLELFTPAPPSTPLTPFIYVGRLAKEKSPHHLLNLVAELIPLYPQTHLTLVGGGPLLASVKKSVRHLGLEPAVTLTGPVSRSRLPNLLHHHRLFISYSVSEVMPLSYIEALACGLPVCVPTKGHIPDLLTSQNSLSLAPNVGQAARQLVKLLQTPKHLTSLSKHAALSAQNFGIAPTAQRILDLYQTKLGH